MAEVKQTIFRPKWYHIILVKYWLVLIILIVLVGFFSEYYFIIKPKIDQAVDGGPLDLGSHQQILTEQKEYLQKLKDLKQEAENINKAELNKLDYVLANSVEMPAILTQIKALDVQSKLELVGFTIGHDKGTIMLAFTFKGGDYQGVKQYLNSIEKNIRIMDVDTITVKELGNVLSLTIKTYYLE